jgi:ABC-type uncharacterized transport system substrate-binding protein
VLRLIENAGRAVFQRPYACRDTELPVEQPVAFELALNLKTAAALGLTVRDNVLVRANKVID